ncbi:MAG: hypothetical protein FDX21_03820 [Chlorobium sp.]|nr:MAG: hypothetical protein FDX21_03820 [Chlorobium sp.]
MPLNIFKWTATLCSLLACTAVITPASANAADIAGGLKASTLGAGVEGTLGLTSDLNLRTGVYVFSYGASTHKSGLPIAYNLNLRSLPVLLDWFLLDDGSGFRFSSGVIINNNKYNANAEPADSYDIGGVVYMADQVGTLNGEVKFGTFAPYVGIGWGNPFTAESHLSFSFDLGIAFQGKPDVAMAATGSVATDPAFQENLRQEEKNIKNEIDAFKYYPVISAGITYRF